MNIYEDDKITVESVMQFLDYEPPGGIYTFENLGSTMVMARSMVEYGAKHCSVVIANWQTEGRGRNGKAFYSVKGGLYMTLILDVNKVNFDPSNVPLTTLFIAVIVCRAIEKLSGKDTSIKWVNDILIQDKKVGGILVESITGKESKYFMVGVGINVTPSELPVMIKDRAGFVYDKFVVGAHNRLAAEIINSVPHMEVMSNEAMFYEYKNRLNTIGKRIKVVDPEDIYEATAVGLGDDGSLLVQKDDGQRVSLVSSTIEYI